MSRATSKIEVGERFERLLQRTVPALSDRVYWVVDDEPPTDALRDQELLTFCFMGGQFDYAGQVGGYVHYQATVRLRIWRTDYSDEHGASREVLMGDPHGLYRYEHLLFQMWNNYLPDDYGNDDLLFEGLKFLSDESPQTVARGGDEDSAGDFTAVLTMDVGLEFKVDLSGAPVLREPE